MAATPTTTVHPITTTAPDVTPDGSRAYWAGLENPAHHTEHKHPEPTTTKHVAPK